MIQQRPRPGIARRATAATIVPMPVRHVQASERHGGHELRPLLVSAQQAASLLGIGRTTLHQLIGNGDLSPIRIGRCVRFAVHELERFVEDQLANR